MTATYGVLCTFLADFKGEIRAAITPFRRWELLTNVVTRARREGLDELYIGSLRVLLRREIRRLQRRGSPGRKEPPKGSRAVFHREEQR